jgi:hypothetical protein
MIRDENDRRLPARLADYCTMLVDRFRCENCCIVRFPSAGQFVVTVMLQVAGESRYEEIATYLFTSDGPAGMVSALHYAPPGRKFAPFDRNPLLSIEPNEMCIISDRPVIV